MKDNIPEIKLKPIGYIRTPEADIPRHWSVSEAIGEIIIDKQYESGLRDMKAGEKILVTFHFHKSPEFTKEYLFQHPPHKDREFGIFSTCSPIRPNPIGVSIVEILEIQGNRIMVKGIDMIDGTPVLDIKPWNE